MKTLWTTPAGSYWARWTDVTDDTHALIAGCTGSGKSVLLHSLIYNLLLDSPAKVKMVLIDPKRVELYKYRSLPHTMAYCQEVSETISTLNRVISAMDERYKAMQKADAVCWSGAHIYVIIDELADIMVTNRADILPRLQRIAQLGRACGIHLLCATQAPSRRVIPAELTLNFTCKVCLHCDSAIESRQVVGENGGECLKPYGEALVRCRGRLERRLVPMTRTDEVEGRIRYWLNQKAEKTTLANVI